MKIAVFTIFLICFIHATYQFVLSKNTEAAFLKRQLRQAPIQSDSTSIEDPNHVSVESASDEINQTNKNRPKRAVPVVSDESAASPEVSVENHNDPAEKTIESNENSVESHENLKPGKKA